MAAVLKKTGSSLEDLLLMQIRAIGLPDPITQFKFAESIGRKWSLDFCWPDLKLAVEVEGGIWSGGRHTRGKGFEEDCRKYNTLQQMGCRLLRFTGDMIKSGEAINLIEQVLKAKE